MSERIWNFFRQGRSVGTCEWLQDGGRVPRLFVTSGSNITHGCRYVTAYWHMKRRSFTLESYFKRKWPRIRSQPRSLTVREW